MQTIRAKFRCNSVAFLGEQSDPNVSRQYTLTAVYDTGTEENRRFNKATPWGELKMTVDNPAAQLEVGEEYYLDFTKASAAVPLEAAEHVDPVLEETQALAPEDQPDAAQAEGERDAAGIAQGEEVETVLSSYDEASYRPEHAAAE